MNAQALDQCLCSGCLATPGGAVPFARGEFADHPSFVGVALKLLSPGTASAGALSCHLVKVEPGCALETHTHPDQNEIHVVLAGGGQADLGRERADYAPGAVSLIPKGVEHRVRAGDDGLLIMALFGPALA